MTDIKCIPEGWELKKLGDISRKLSLNKIKIKQKEYLETGKFPVIDQGQELIGGYFDDENLLVPDEPPYIIFGDHTKVKKFISTKFIPGADGVKVLKAKDNVLPKFLYYLLFTIKIEDKGYARHFQLVEKENFLLPPIETQQAIVSKIEELFSELDKGIAELKLAQEQLKVYRQSVLKYAFEGKLTNENVKDGELPKGWEITTISDLAHKDKHSLKAGPFGSSLKKEFYVPRGYKVYGQEQVISGDAFLGDYYINEEKYQELKSCKIKPLDILISLVGTVGKVLILPENCLEGIINPRLIKISLDTNQYLPLFFKYYFESSKVKNLYITEAKGTTMSVLNLSIIKTIPFPRPSIEEQTKIIQEIENRLSVADKMEESIIESLQKAEALRQSILKKAFSGELVKEVKAIEVPKIKNEYFHQLQLVALVINGFKKEKIDHGEMTLAKNLYLLDSIYKIPTGFTYDRWHLGPYPPALKKVVNNKEYFKRSEIFIEATNDDKLLKYTNLYQDEVNAAISDLSAIFSKYKGAERSHKTELLATVCKVIEDIKSTDLAVVRQSMAEWKIDLKTSKFKNKAEKFNEPETKKCIEFIVERGWDRKLI